MERNKLLWLALLVCRLFKAIQIILILVLTFVLLHWYLDRDYYTDIKYTGPFSLDFSVGEFLIGAKAAPDAVPLAEIAPLSMLILYIQAVAILILTLMAVSEFMKVIQSVKEVQAFRKGNTEAFRRMGKYFLLIFILSSFEFLMRGQDGSYNVKFEVSPDFPPLLLMLAAFILAEVFREGNRLYEDQQFTI